MEKQILVLGGTGKTGSRVARKLMDLGKQFRIGSRSASPPFDWEKQQTWNVVLQDIDTVYITFQPDLAVPGALDSIAAFTNEAINCGVKKLVLLSGKGEKEAEACEQVIINSGLNWIIVRASWFNQNFSESFFLGPILGGHVALPKAEVLVPYVDADDIADVVVEALLNDKHNGQLYKLTGPRKLTFENVVNEIAKATALEINFQSITMDEYIQMLKEYQTPDDYIWLISYLFTEVLIEKNSAVTHDIEKILGRKAKNFSEYAKETASTGVWNALTKHFTS